MALRQASLGLSTTIPRIFANSGALLGNSLSNNTFNSTFFPLHQNDDDDLESKKRESERYKAQAFHLATQPKPCNPALQAMSSVVRQSFMGKALPLPSGLGVFGQRSFQTWSPVQRYFIEGDEIVQAEANRSFQFTGLDSGSLYPVMLYACVATVLASAFTVIPFVIAPARVDLDKASAYECGFDAFGDSRGTFSVSFYLVSIMYLLFDIEIAYLFPYVMTNSNGYMFWMMQLFLGILTAGFIYEWGVGALEWRDTTADHETHQHA